MLPIKQADVLAGLEALEQQISPAVIAEDHLPWFKQVSGKHPVLLSAPHACCHLRDGAIKMAEEYTAAMACLVARLTGCSAIFTTHQSSEDPNWQPGGEYKNAIREMVESKGIKFLIDIHGMTNRHHIGVAIGTINGRACRSVDIIEPFEDEGFQTTQAQTLPPMLTAKEGVPVSSSIGAAEAQHWRRMVIDHPRFTGGVKSQTVTRFAAEQLGILSVQIELASVARIGYRPKTQDWPCDYRGNPEAITAAVNALCRLAKKL